MKNKLLKTTFMSFVSQCVALVCGFILPRWIIEHFGSDVYGLTQSIKQFLGVIMFMDLGIGQVIRSALYGPLQRKDPINISKVMASGWKFYRSLAAVLAVYGALLIVFYPLVAGQEFGAFYTATLIFAMAISTFVQFYFGIINEQLLHADQRGYVIFSLQILTTLSNLVACGALIRAGASIQLVKLATSVVYLVRPVFISLYIKKHYSISKKVTYDADILKQKWNGIAHHVSAVVLDGTDTIVLTLFSTLSNVSIYSVYYMVVSSIQTFYQSAMAGVQSAAGAVWAGGDIHSQRKMFSTVELILHTVTVVLFCCTGLLIVPFIRVYTSGLTDAQYIQPFFAAILVLAYGIRSLRTPYNIWILAAGHYKQTQRCHITAAALNLGISILAVFQWGLVGIAVGTLIAMCYQTTWMAIYNARHLMRQPVISLAKRFAVDILITGLVLLTCRGFVMHDNSYIGWLVLAVKTGCTTLTVTGVVTLIFYRKLLLQLLRRNA